MTRDLTDLTDLTDEQIDRMTPAQLCRTLAKAEKQFKRLAGRVAAKHGHDPEIRRDIEEVVRRLGV